jgi:HPt (histidine-containing phosphotransfer) domain-containing protein
VRPALSARCIGFIGRAVSFSVAEAISEGSAEGVQRAAHTLKSSSAILGAQLLAPLCGALEMLAREERLDEAIDHLRHIEAAYEEVEHVLREI